MLDIMNWRVFDLTRSFGKFRVAWHHAAVCRGGVWTALPAPVTGSPREVVGRGRQGDAERFADGPGTSRRLSTQYEALVVLIDRDFLDPVEIAHHIGPFEFEAGGGEAL